VLSIDDDASLEELQTFRAKGHTLGAAQRRTSVGVEDESVELDPHASTLTPTT
jgi:hypothetical protein